MTDIWRKGQPHLRWQRRHRLGTEQIEQRSLQREAALAGRNRRLGESDEARDSHLARLVHRLDLGPAVRDGSYHQLRRQRWWGAHLQLLRWRRR
jgi:hypothetical protein